MKGLLVGHFTDTKHATGVSVFLFEHSVPAACCIMGSSPATREIQILDVHTNTDSINGLALSGGSAFGLGVVDGVMQWQREQGKGKQMPKGVIVPIVPGAAIYDLGMKSSTPPSAAQAYQACRDAIPDNLVQGRIGAGTGASVGKLVAEASPMSGGLGVAQIKLDNGLEVIAYAVVNAVGDIRDDQDNIVAGAKRADGSFVDSRQYLLAGNPEKITTQENTTLVAVFTNAAFSRVELKRIAHMALAGMANAISPVFTRYDGDLIFAVSLGAHQASELTVGTIAVEVVRQAIINAVKESIIL